MSISQYIYTSWREHGFRVFACSDALTDQDKSAIFKHVKYTPPVDLPDTSDPERIRLSYPLKYASFPVGDQRCISMTRYLGQDDSGRFGNYIAHAYVFPKAPDFYPTDLFFEPIWKERLTEDEKNAAPEKTRLSAPDSLPHGKGLDWDCLADFIAAEGEEKYKLLINAFLYAKARKQRLVIHDARDRLIYWFALLVHSLPKSAAMRISFATYVFDFLQSSLDVIGVPSENCYFNYAAESRNGRMTVLDFEHEIYTPDIPETTFADFMSTCMQYSKEQLTRCHLFMETYAPNAAWEDLPALCQLYGFCEKDCPDDPEELAGMTALADRLASPGIVALMCDKLTDMLYMTPAQQMRKEMAFFLIAHRAERESEALSMLHDDVCDTLLTGDDETARRMLSTCLARAPGVFAYAADDVMAQRVLTLVTDADAAPAPCAWFVAYLALGYAQKGTYPASADQPAAKLLARVGQALAPREFLRRVMPTAAPDTLAWLLSLMKRLPEAFDEDYLFLVMTDALRGANREFAAALEYRLSRDDAMRGLSVRLLLTAAPFTKECRARFWSLLGGLPEQAAQTYVEAYLRRAGASEASETALDVVAHYPLSRLGDGALERLSQMLGALPLARLMDQYAREASMTLNECQRRAVLPRAATLAAFRQHTRVCDACARAQKLCDIPDLERVNVARGLLRADYETYVERLMPLLAPLVLDDADLSALARMLGMNAGDPFLSAQYAGRLKALAANARAHMPALRCVLQCHTAQRFVPPEIQCGEAKIIAVYAKLDDALLQELLLSVQCTPDSAEPFVAEIMSVRNRSFGSRVLNLFGRK